MEAFSIMLRIIRMYMVKGVKILLIAVILALLDFFLSITLQNFSSIVPVSVIIERAWLYSMNFFVSGICTPFPPFQSFLLPAELPWDFPLSRLHQSLTWKAKGSQPLEWLYFQGGRWGGEEWGSWLLLRRLVGQTCEWVTSSLVWGRAEHLLPGQLHCCDPFPSPAAYFQEIWDVAGYTISQPFEEKQKMSGYLGCYFQQNFEIWGWRIIWDLSRICPWHRASLSQQISARWHPELRVMCALCMSYFVGTCRQIFSIIRLIQSKHYKFLNSLKQ